MRRSVIRIVAVLPIMAALLFGGCNYSSEPQTAEAVYDTLQGHLEEERWDLAFNYLSAKSQAQLISAVGFMVERRMVDTEGRVPSARWALRHPRKAVQIVASLSGDFDRTYITPNYHLLERKDIKGRKIFRYQYTDTAGRLFQRRVFFARENGVWRVDIDLTLPGDIDDSGVVGSD